jgi:hypothetical protein
MPIARLVMSLVLDAMIHNRVILAVEFPTALAGNGTLVVRDVRA